MAEIADAPSRVIRSIDVDASDARISNGIAALYDDTLDVIVIRGAFPKAALLAAGDRLDRDDGDTGWTRPNEKLPADDIRMLGTPATPTYIAPRGPSLESYLEDADKNRTLGDRVFDASFNANRAVPRALAQLSGGRPVEILHTADGREFAPFTVRRLVNGTQIALHHDYHYPLPLYSELAPGLDTRTLVSWVGIVRRPEGGGELFVYPVTPDMPDPPKLPNGWAWDLEAIERRFEFAKFVMNEGDMFVFASGRCLHRVAPIAGPRARVTMGGFLALAKDGTRVLYWS